MADIDMYSVLGSGTDPAAMPDEQVLNGNQPDVDERENQDEEAVAMVEEPHSGI